MFGFVKSAMSLGAMPVVHDVRRHELAAQRDASLHSMDDVLFALCEAQVSEDVQMNVFETFNMSTLQTVDKVQAYNDALPAVAPSKAAVMKEVSRTTSSFRAKAAHKKLSSAPAHHKLPKTAAVEADQVRKQKLIKTRRQAKVQSKGPRVPSPAPTVGESDDESRSSGSFSVDIPSPTPSHSSLPETPPVPAVLPPVKDWAVFPDVWSLPDLHPCPQLLKLKRTRRQTSITAAALKELNASLDDTKPHRVARRQSPTSDEDLSSPAGPTRSRGSARRHSPMALPDIGSLTLHSKRPRPPMPSPAAAGQVARPAEKSTYRHSPPPPKSVIRHEDSHLRRPFLTNYRVPPELLYEPRPTTAQMDGGLPHPPKPKTSVPRAASGAATPVLRDCAGFVVPPVPSRTSKLPIRDYGHDARARDRARDALACGKLPADFSRLSLV